MNLHPISQVLNLCHTEKNTIASFAITHAIKGDFSFSEDEIGIFSQQFYNGLMVSKMIPKNRFTVKFDPKLLSDILKKGKASQNELYILLSCVSWIINAEDSQNINNFDLILDVLDSCPNTIGENTCLSIYKLTNYFFECVLRMNQEYSYQDIEYQTVRFLNRYKEIYKEDLINDTLLKWLKIGYSFEKQTSFTQNILLLTGNFAKENLSLFSESAFNEICNITKNCLSNFSSHELSFLIKYANIFPHYILLDNLNFFVKSILPYFKLKNDIQYKIFDQEKYSESKESNIIQDLPQSVFVLPQFSSFKYAYKDEIYIFPYFEVDPSFTFSSSIVKIMKKIFIFFENGIKFKYEEFDLDHLNSLFENILSECLNDSDNQQYLFDIIAAILSFIKIYEENYRRSRQNKRGKMQVTDENYKYKYNTFPIFQILIDSPLFDHRLTIFTKDNGNESVHKLRMMSYYLLVFQNEQNIHLFFSKKQNYPFMISEFFFYGLNYKKYESSVIPKEILENENLDNKILDSNILESQIFMDSIYQIILSYLNKADAKANKNDNQKLTANSFTSFDMKQIENSIVENENNEINDNNNISLQESLNENENKSAKDPPTHFKTQSNILLTSDYESQQSFVSNESNSENSTTKFQTVKNSIPKIQHRKPIADVDNNFLKWFNAIKNDEKKVNSIKEEYTFDNLVECTLVYSLVFISNIIENNEEVSSLWNESATLVSLFFHLIFNEYIRPIILDILFKFWSSKKSLVTLNSQDFISHIFEQKYDDDYSLLDLQLLETINKYLYHKANDTDISFLISPFLNLYQYITSIMINCDISSDFLHNLMILFSFYTKTIKRKARVAISSSLLRISGKNPDRRFYHDFILIITSFSNENESGEFLIAQPKMVSVFINSFSESQFLEEIFDFIHSLCENSVANAISCHNGNVDIALIKYILNHKESSLIPKVLDLFSIIASTASSIPVVSQFISLFSPIESRFTPPYILDCTQTFAKIIRTIQTRPTAYLPISKKSPYVEIKKLKKSKIDQGFTFTAQLFLDKFSLKYQSKLLQILDPNNFINITLSINDGQIIMHNSAIGNSKPFEKIIIPTNCWFNIAVSFIPSKKWIQCQIENQISGFECIFPSFPSNSTLTCDVGNGSASDNFMMHAALIANFAFYPISRSVQESTDFDKIKNQPLFDFQNIENNPWISVKFDIDQSLLKIVVEPSQPELNAFLFGENLISNLTFPGVFLKFFKAEIVIPLYAQIGFPVYKNNDDVLKDVNAKSFSIIYTKYIYDLLLVILHIGKKEQQSFAKSEGFRIISYLLENTTDPSILTIDLYMHFASLMEYFTYQKLSIQMLYYILMNADIWSRSTDNIFHEIVDYWNNIFLNQDWFLAHYPFFKLLIPISKFYERIEKEKNDKSKIDIARKAIRQFLCNVASIRFTEYDLNALILMCIAHSDNIFRQDLLTLIQDIAKMNDSPFLKLFQSDRQNLFNDLDSILSEKNEENVLLAIETILTLHKRKIIQNIKINQHIEIMMMQLSKKIINESFIMKLFDLSKNSFNEALPIPFYIILSSCYSVSESAFLTNQKSLIEIVKKLQPDLIYNVDKLWFFWPLIFAIKNNEALEFVLNFIILSSLKNWMNIFITIYIICNCLDIDYMPAQRSFLMILADNILKGNVKDDVFTFLELTFFFIFTKTRYKKSFFPQHLFDNSVFKGNSGNTESSNISLDSSNSIQSESNNKESMEQNNNENIDQNNNKSTDMNETSNQKSNVNDSNSNKSGNSKLFFDINLFKKKFSEFSKKELESSEFTILFDIDDDGNWLDQKLSILFMQVYDQYSTHKKVSPYLFYFNQYLKEKKSNQENPNKIKSHHDLYKMYQFSVKFIDDIIINIKDLQNYIDENIIKAVIDENKIKKVCENSAIYITKIENQNKLSKVKSHNLWFDLWRNLTNERSPWRNSLPHSEMHFKRNNRILAHDCPVKLKQNLNFKDHKDASFNREYGSSEMAREKYKNYNLEKKKQEPPSSLLSINHNEVIDYNNDQLNIETLTIDEQAKYYFSHCYNTNLTNNHPQSQLYQQQNEMINDKNSRKEAKLLTLKGPKKIDLYISSKCIKIFYRPTEKDQIKHDIKIKQINVSEIRCILYRSFLHKEKSFEIVKNNGKSYLINLKKERSLDLLQEIKSDYSSYKNVLIQTDPPKEFIHKMGFQEKWVKGLISNFEYLMDLNFYSGRSFNEASLYPVFPWIIKDYSSTKIDLKDENIYRDLSTPIGALNLERLNDLKKHYQDYISFRNEGFLYNSCFISPLCVYLWLIRVEPFASLHIELQSGRFDYASRIFTSIPSAFNMVINHMNDYRELIPEFFYTSSFLENRNHFDLGILRNRQVDDVILPNWCKSAIEFVYIHRKALESDYVNNHLSEWIDLIFGYCQKNEKAVEKNNTFDPCLYDDIWSKEGSDEESQRKMIKAVLKHCGHIPNQIFNEKHPTKNKFKVVPFSTFRTIVPSTEGNFPKSAFIMLFTKKPNENPNGRFSNKRCIFVSNSGIISIAALTIEKDSNDDPYFKIISHNSIGKLSPSNLKRKQLEKTPSTQLSISPYYINAYRNDSENSNLSLESIDKDQLKINLTIANMSEKSRIFAFNPSSSLLVVATNIGAIIVAQILGGTNKYGLLTRHVGRVNCVAISDHFIVSGGSDTSINIWHINNEIQLEKVLKSEVISLSQQSSSMSSLKPTVEAERRKSVGTEKTQDYKYINDENSESIKHLKEIQSFRNEITCIDISEKFGTIASGTKDGSIILIDTKSLESTVTIKIAHEVPMMVKITSGWGFVVVYSKKEHEGQIQFYLSVFDIDGQLIRKKQVDFEIDCWTQFTSIDGFDFMVFGSTNLSYQNNGNQENGGKNEKSISSQNKFNLYMFEVFYLDIEKAGIKETNSRFMELKYCFKKGILYAITENGTINIYPTDKLNTERFNRTVFENI